MNMLTTVPLRKIIIPLLAGITAFSCNLVGQEDRQYTQEERQEAYKLGVAYKSKISRDPSTWKWCIPLDLK